MTPRRVVMVAMPCAEVMEIGGTPRTAGTRAHLGHLPRPSASWATASLAGGDYMNQRIAVRHLAKPSTETSWRRP